ncbi:hypothetical protein EV360DRAFT_71258 [Lentinula raphanica]|nr:hypothetical protein EV360DRAFT_71258 [Lentinula raphanica]
MPSSLPNELLHYITEYISHTLGQPESCYLCSNLVFKVATPELLALSVVNRRLRRICLPFLFAHIEISHNKAAKNLEDHLPLCAKYTNLTDQIISRILPHLEQLVAVRLERCQRRPHLLETILAHPTLTSVLVNEGPHVSMRAHDLSKVILFQTKPPFSSISISPFSPTFKTFLDQGMTLECLSLETDSVDNRLESHNFPGLKIIEIFMGKAVVSFSWLSPFVSAHPNLIGFFLTEIDQEFSAHNAPPFLSSLVEETQRQGLQQSHRISSVGFLRAKPINESSQEPEWRAIELELTINHSLTEVLTLFASSYPKLETLTLEFELVNERIHIDKLSSALARFPSLRVVYLINTCAHLGADAKMELPPVERVGTVDILAAMRMCVQDELLALASHLAKQVRTLDSVHFQDLGWMFDDEYEETIGHWFLKGWIHVLNSNRDISGILKFW